MQHGTNDAFRRKGLGPNARRIWISLEENPYRSIVDISLDLRLHRDTVRRNLKELERFRLAVQRGYPAKWAAQKRDLDSVASELGTAGMLDRQRAQHEFERYGFYLNFILRRSKATESKED